ncbi:tapasin-related protein isoform X1 [Alligator mississippiensis]|uniref:Tapasin-related protein isoform A n=1 Tax=Alligator mississippiensis TaxID=8496 RepID=A0A151MD09_ALLMI|nr:tapasin-related protein isoform X1 [Alligator mississippiensis]KYO22280.1 tapasin-related protein isoform A [Alligator mississippiensis]
MSLGLVLFCGLLALKAGWTEDLGPRSSLRSVDVVLDCLYIEETAGDLPGSFASSFSQDSATLVLRDVSVINDGSLDDVTNYEVPGASTGSAPPLIFEASAKLVAIPYAESLLHADCSGEEVTCEISLYSRHQTDEGTCQSSWFMGTLKLSSGISIALVLRGPCRSDGKEEERMIVLHPKLKVPVSNEGTVLTTVEFQSSSLTPTLRTRLGSSVTLNCRFALAPGSPLALLEWRLQHQGSGRSVFRYQTGSEPQEEQPTAHVDMVQLLETGDASLSLRGVGMKDEGTYICLVSSPKHQTQHIIQLQLAEPPRVRLFPDLVSREGDGTTTLTCEISGYYPLDVSVSWTRESPEDEDKVPIPSSSIYFSSHRQGQVGTYSISSYLLINLATELAPVTFSCHVSHLALEEPVVVSAHLRAPDQKTSKVVVGVIISTALFVVALFGLTHRWRKPVDLKAE